MRPLLENDKTDYGEYPADTLKHIKRGLIYTNGNCTGCNKCIKVCGVMGACVAADVLENDNSRIAVDGARCILCGSCLDACEHNAREFEDDTLRFFCGSRQRGKHIRSDRARFESEFSEQLQ